MHPTGRAAGSVLKTKLLSDIVKSPEDPVDKVPSTDAEATETESKLAARTVAVLKNTRKLLNLLFILTPIY